MKEVRLKIDSLDTIELVAKRFIELIRGKGNVIAFYGQMGAGKTTFIKSLCKVMGVIDLVGSPTFNIVNEYATKDGDAVYHFDFYRIESLEEAFDIGIEEYFYCDALCLIEWPQKVEQILPSDLIKVQISVLDGELESRELVFWI